MLDNGIPLPVTPPDRPLQPLPLIVTTDLHFPPTISSYSFKTADHHTATTPPCCSDQWCLSFCSATCTYLWRRLLSSWFQLLTDSQPRRRQLPLPATSLHVLNSPQRLLQEHYPLYLSHKLMHLMEEWED